ncbi:hypothetical protein V8E54_013931 [Elaphomyces granulatus]
MAEYSTILRLFPLLWLSHFFKYTLSQCYNPDGTPAAQGHYPCQFAFTTFCCLQGWTCFSNDLCIATDPSVISSAVAIGTSYRGSCTNPNWNDSACGNFCLNDNSGALVSCPQNNRWCCEPDYQAGSCNCQTGQGTFSLSDGHAITIIGIENLVHTATATSESILSTDTATSSSNSGQSSTALTTSSTTTSGTHISSLSTAPTSTTSPAPPTNPEHSTGLIVGIPVSVGGVCVLLLVVLCVACRRKYRWTRTLRFWEWRGGINRKTRTPTGQPTPIPRYDPPITEDNPYQAHMELSPFHTSNSSTT